MDPNQNRAPPYDYNTYMPPATRPGAERAPPIPRPPQSFGVSLNATIPPLNPGSLITFPAPVIGGQGPSLQPAPSVGHGYTGRPLLPAGIGHNAMVHPAPIAPIAMGPVPQFTPTFRIRQIVMFLGKRIRDGYFAVHISRLDEQLMAAMKKEAIRLVMSAAKAQNIRGDSKFRNRGTFAKLMAGDHMLCLKTEVATFSFVDLTQLGDNRYITSLMNQYIKDFAKNAKYPGLELELTWDFVWGKSRIRTLDSDEKTRQELSFGLRTHFECQYSRCPFWPREQPGTCMRLDNRHVTIDKNMMNEAVEAAVRQQKPVATLILELVQAVIEKEQDEQRDQLTSRTDFSHAFDQMPFLRGFLPVDTGLSKNIEVPWNNDVPGNREPVNREPVNSGSSHFLDSEPANRQPMKSESSNVIDSEPANRELVDSGSGDFIDSEPANREPMDSESSNVIDSEPANRELVDSGSSNVFHSEPENFDWSNFDCTAVLKDAMQGTWPM